MNYSQAEALSKDINTPSEVLEKLAKNSNEHLRKNVAENLSTPEKILNRLSKSTNRVKEAVASNPNTPSKVLEKMHFNNIDNMIILKAIVRNPNTSEEVLERLSRNIFAAEALAKNVNCPIHILEKLSNDISTDVIIAVAKNPSTPLNVLEKLSESRVAEVKKAVAKNENTPIEILEKLSKNNDDKINEIISNHPKIIEANKVAKLETIKNDSISLEEFERLAKSPNAEIRANVAKNENCPNSILQLLASDLNDNVSFPAIRNKNYEDSSDDDNMFDFA